MAMKPRSPVAWSANACTPSCPWKAGDSKMLTGMLASGARGAKERPITPPDEGSQPHARRDDRDHHRPGWGDALGRLRAPGIAGAPDGNGAAGSPTKAR